MKKFISWNVNGFRAVLTKGFEAFFKEIDADFFCIQETKMQPGQAEIHTPGYQAYWNSAIKKGYSGTAIFTKHAPLSVLYGIDIAEHDQEGRVLTLEMENFYLVNCYTPNAQRELTRLAYRMTWEEAFRGFLLSLDSKKPVILCGDLNVAHQAIDLKNPKPNEGHAGYTKEERAQMTNLLASGFIDSYRLLYPEATDAYTWWSYMGGARSRNVGWRIDYFIVSNRLQKTIQHAGIHPDIMGSDHCPVELIVAD